MGLNMHVISEDLKTLFEGSVCNSDYNVGRLETVYLGLDDLHELSNRILYIVDSDSCTENVCRFICSKAKKESALSFVTIGKPNDYLLSCEYCDIAWTSKTTTIESIHNKIQELFHAYDRWIFNLQSITHHSDQPSDLLNESIDIFKNDILVCDDNMSVIAYKAFRKNDISGISQGAPLPSNLQICLEKHFEPHKATLFKNPAIINLPKPYSRAICRTIFPENKTTYKLIVLETNKQITPRDVQMVWRFTYYLEILFSHLDISGKNDYNDWLNIFKLLLNEEETLTDQRIINALSVLDWHLDNRDEYICLSFNFYSPATKFITNYLKPTLTLKAFLDSMADCICFNYNAGIVSIVNLSTSQSTAQELLDVLIKASEQDKLAGWVIGMSRSFNNLRQLPYYYQQAYLAMKHSKQTDCTVTFFENSYLEIAAEILSSQIPIEYIQEPSLAILAKYDNTYSTQLYDTLKIFLKNRCSPTHTCNELFIKRSGLAYRLNKIKSLCDLNLEDPIIRFRLELSFAIADWRMKQ